MLSRNLKVRWFTMKKLRRNIGGVNPKAKRQYNYQSRNNEDLWWWSWGNREIHEILIWQNQKGYMIAGL